MFDFSFRDFPDHEPPEHTVQNQQVEEVPLERDAAYVCPREKAPGERGRTQQGYLRKLREELDYQDGTEGDQNHLPHVEDQGVLAQTRPLLPLDVDEGAHVRRCPLDQVRDPSPTV